jgi:signal transduction histidine kinase
MVVANAITALSYLCICLTLFYLVRHTRRVLARDWAYFAVGFALFIVACGSTHLMEVVTTWQPWFWLDASANILTALLSAWVAIALIGRVRILGDGINDYASRLANTEVEQRQMRDSLMAAQKLEDWSKMSTVFAHEIANPLETIQNLLYLIRNGDGVQPEIAAMAANAAEEADRVLAISRTTLGFFRQSTEFEATDLYAAAESVHFLLHNRLKKHGVTLQILSTGDTTVQALPGESRQVLLNLVRNACEASTSEHGSVTVTLTGKPSGVEITVADRGTGIDPAILPQLFTFGVSTKGEKGNGMGLWAVRYILTRHGGDIRVASTQGEGTTFTLWWPRTINAESRE